MTRALATAAAALAIALVGAEAAQACSCVPPDPDRMLKEADGAIVGRLLTVRVVDPPAAGVPSGAEAADYIYRVGRVYNGGPGLRRGRKVRVRSALDSATCGLPDGRGKLYGLFLTRRHKRWTSNLCNVISRRAMRRAAARSGRSSARSPDSAGCD
jgi:hypothetical protein